MEDSETTGTKHPETQLQETSTTTAEPEATVATQKEREKDERINFKCSNCLMSEKCHYLGRTPPFAPHLEFLEDCYIMKDPYSKPPTKAAPKCDYALVLGSECSVCEKVICKSMQCSIYYKKTFCLTCAKAKFKSFPLEIQTKINRSIASAQSK